MGVWEKLHSENMCGTRKYPHDKLWHTQSHNKERHSLTSHNNAPLGPCHTEATQQATFPKKLQLLQNYLSKLGSVVIPGKWSKTNTSFPIQQITIFFIFFLSKRWAAFSDHSFTQMYTVI